MPPIVARLASQSYEEASDRIIVKLSRFDELEDVNAAVETDGDSPTYDKETAQYLITGLGIDGGTF